MVRPRTPRRTALAAALSAVLAATAFSAAVAPAEAAKTKSGKKDRSISVAWAPADSATIHPGIQMYTDGAQCTGNFVFTDSAANVYVGYAAHCAGTGAATDTDGCKAG
jgi:DMSO/TMAO reductase YedYZ molybdopterin-dependent catalytic subunit